MKYFIIIEPEAKEDLRSILDLDPNHVHALNALGFTLLQQNEKIDEAFPFINKAHMLMPENPAFLDSMGWYYYHKKDLGKAIEFLAKAYEKQQNLETSYHFAKVLHSAGKKEQAKKVINNSINKFPDNTKFKQLLNQL